MTELYIDENLIDLSPNQTIAISYQIKAIADVRNQKANFTNQIKIPATRENLRQFGFSFDFSSTDKRPYRKLPARLIHEGTEIIRNGLAVIKKTDSHVSIEIFSGIIDFFDAIGDKNLSDLDLSEFDHTWDVADISSLANSEIGVCYPLVNYGTILAAGSNIKANFQHFGIYVKTIIDKIFESVGYTQAGVFFDNEPDYDKLLIQFSNEKYIDKSKPGLDFKVTGDEFFKYDTVTNTNIGCFQRITFDTVEYDSTLGAGWIDGSNKYIAATDFVGSLRLSGYFNIDALGATSAKAVVRIVSNLKGELVRYEFNPLQGINEVDISIGEKMYFNDFEEFHCEVYFGDGMPVNGSALFTGSFMLEADEEIIFGMEVKVSDNLPDIKQKDFLKNIAHMYGLIYQPTPESKEINFRKFDELESNKHLAKDWSDKLNLISQPQWEYDLGFAQANNFKYKAQEGETVTGSDGTITIDDDNLPSEKDVIEMEFSGSLDQVVLGNLRAPILKKYESRIGFAAPSDFDGPTQYFEGDKVYHNDQLFEALSGPFTGSDNPPNNKYVAGVNSHEKDAPDADYDYTEFWQRLDIDEGLSFSNENETDPRIFLSEKITLQNQINISDELSVDNQNISEIIRPWFIRSDKNRNLGFGNNLLSRNYVVLSMVLDGAKSLNAYFNLKDDDIEQLDFLIPVYISYFSSYFYINRIDKYIPGRSTNVNLIKI